MTHAECINGQISWNCVTFFYFGLRNNNLAELRVDIKG